MHSCCQPARASTVVQQHTRQLPVPSSLPCRLSVPRRCLSSLVKVRAEGESSTAVEEAKPAATTSTSPGSAPTTAAAIPSSSSSSNGPAVALGAVAVAVALFAATRLGGGAPTLATLEAQSTPLEVALTNGKPTVLEFYASWCEVCRELAPMEYQVEQQYKDKVNFVMLNIENSKWAPEVAEFGVSGIPHFVFVDKEGRALAAAVGKLPEEVFAGNVSALADEQQLPYARISRGPTSAMQRPDGMAAPRAANPRDHA